MVTKKCQQKIEFTKRDTTGTGVCRKIRSKNMVPVVLYGPEYKNGLAGVVSARAISPIANSKFKETTVIELAIDGGEVCSAIIRDVQRHPLTLNLRHIDFYQVLKGHKIKVEVPIRIINGELAPGVKDGGVLNQTGRIVTLEIKPSDIPEEIVFDAKDLEVGTEILIKDLNLPGDSECLTPMDAIVLHILAPKSSSDDALDEEGEKEVEVVAKGKASKEE